MSSNTSNVGIVAGLITMSIIVLILVAVILFLGLGWYR